MTTTFAPPGRSSSALKRASEHRLDTERREKVRRGLQNRRRARARSSGEIPALESGFREARERARLALILQQTRIGKRRAVALGNLLRHEQEPGGFAERRVEQERLDTLKSAVLAPMPRARVRTATAVKPGEFPPTSARRSAHRVRDSPATAGPRASRCSSRVCSTPPRAIRAWRRASAGVMPARRLSAAAASRCCASSSLKSASSADLVKTARKRARKVANEVHGGLGAISPRRARRTRILRD